MIWHAFLDRVALADESRGLVQNGQTMSYAEFMERARDTPIPSSCGRVPTVRRVVIRHQDPYRLLLTLFASWSRGLVPVVTRGTTTDTQLEEIVSLLRPVGVMTDAYAARITPHSAPAYGERIAPREEGLIVCTSGTTGDPRLVALPAESVCINASTIAGRLGLSTRDVVAVSTPLGYMYGLLGGCLASIWAGAAVILPSSEAPAVELHTLIRDSEVSVVQGPPSLLRLFLAYWDGRPYKYVRVLTTGGEPLSEGSAEQLRRAFPHADMRFLYGMTEAGPRISDARFSEGGGQDGFIGTPYNHFEWRIDPIEGVSTTVGGRLVLRGPSMMLGYVGVDGQYSGLDSDGYFHSNDVVGRCADGGLRFEGRLDRVFRSGGRLINPEPIERLLRRHPMVEEVLCRPEEHEILGLVPVVDVVCKGPQRPTLADVRAFCAEDVEAFAIPRSIYHHEELAIEGSGKRQVH